MQTAIVGGDVSALKAREAFLAYRNLVKEGRATEDDELLMRAYKVIATGNRVLDLRETLKQAGLDEQMRPRLAVARADLKQVFFERVSHMGRWCYLHKEDRGRRPAIADGRAIVVRPGIYTQLDGGGWTAPAIPGKPGSGYQRLRAAVPTIPAHLRPPSASLSGLHILWEAEWEPVAPRDPILLKRIGGYLYAVLAQWDLTELERAVLGARLS